MYIKEYTDPECTDQSAFEIKGLGNSLRSKCLTQTYSKQVLVELKTYYKSYKGI